MDFARFSLSGLPLTGAELPDGLLAALVSAVATVALIAAFGPRRAPARASEAATRDSGACDYLVDGASLKPLTDAARELLDGLAPGGARLAALAAHLADDCPSLQADLETLVLYGTPFRHHCPRGDGTAVEITGTPRDGAAFLSIRPASAEARALKDAEAELARTGAELAFLQDVLDGAPVLAWSQGPDGQVSWANAAYRDRFDAPAGDLPDHRIADAFGHVLEQVPLTARGAGSRRRVAVPDREDGEPQWYELSETRRPAGETVGFALEADDLVAAEASLRRFIETLTETFAHLPIGLAVFDKNRRLGLFNPALTDLVKIDAVWLAGRPSLRDFLERLRETRQMPEQKDFASFRRKLSELEEGAREGTYEENWQLPSGKIFRVTGRPHPQGALAFLFEDISSSIILERKLPLRAGAQPGDARPDVRGGGGVRRLGDAGLRQLRLRAALGPRPDGAARRPRRRRDDRDLGRALPARARSGPGSPSSPPPARRAPAGPTRSPPARAPACTCWWRRSPTPRRWSSSATSPPRPRPPQARRPRWPRAPGRRPATPL